MKRILIPTERAEDWRRLLASPEKHWKPGYSAMTLALAWEQSAGDFPPEVAAALAASGHPVLTRLKPLIIVPEYQFPLPGGRRASQSDVLVVATDGSTLVAIVVEGKVDEPFGPTIGEWKRIDSGGRSIRLSYLLERLQLTNPPDSIRYQLLHRSVSALLAATEFCTRHAVMLVHSFSPTDRWFGDFESFAALYGQRPNTGSVVPLGMFGQVELFAGWCAGDQKYRRVVPVGSEAKVIPQD